MSIAQIVMRWGCFGACHRCTLYWLFLSISDGNATKSPNVPKTKDQRRSAQLKTNNKNWDVFCQRNHLKTDELKFAE